MPTPISLASCLLLFLLLALGGKSSHVRHSQHSGSAVGRAVYFLTNDDVNGVAAIPIGTDGKLTRGTVTETGGAGSVAVNADNQPATPDALVGQSALAISGNVRRRLLDPQAIPKAAIADALTLMRLPLP